MILRILKWTLRVAGVLLVLVVAYFGVTFVQIWLRGHEHTTRSAQAILVFGTTEDDGVPSAELKTRLDQALSLYDEGRAPWVAVTGGKRPGTPTPKPRCQPPIWSAGACPRRGSSSAGAPTPGRTSQRSCRSSRRMHIKTVITVTDPFHEYRAMAIASAQGLIPYPSPVRDSPTIKYQLWRYYLKETLDVGVGRIVGYARLSSMDDGVVRRLAPSKVDQVRLPSPSGVV